MTWVRIDDNFPQHPKIAIAGYTGLALHIAGLCYASRFLTNGFVPEAHAQTLLNMKKATYAETVKKLIVAGLWEEAEGGYVIHDYLEYNPSREQVLAERDKAKSRMNKARSSRKVRANNWRTSPNGGVERSSPNPTPTPSPLPEVPSEPSEGQSFGPREVVEIWNEVMDGALPQVERLSDGRKRSVRGRLMAEKGRDADWWRAYFQRIKSTSFCLGENGNGWRATFDWAVRSEDVVAKVLEGNYDRTPKTNGFQPSIGAVDWEAEAAKWTR